MSNRGRKSKAQELQIVQYMAELQPKVFAVLSEALISEQKSDRHWAVEQMSKLYAKAVPQKIGGDPDNNTAIPISILNAATQKPKVNA